LFGCLIDPTFFLETMFWLSLFVLVSGHQSEVTTCLTTCESILFLAFFKDMTTTRGRVIKANLS